jgi:SAM-dependent methyltransferase
LRPEHLSILACPRSGRPLVLGDRPVLEGSRVKEGVLIEPQSGASYVIRDFIPRFAGDDNYAENFGVEWTIHNRTQYDDHSGFSVSQDRFEMDTGWGRDLRGEVILEVGSGSGRFTTHALKTGATVVSFDYSRAVEANYGSNGNHENLLLVQASVYEMPFRLDYFDKAFCFGVLQHTPDPREAFMSIVRHVKPGGKIAADVYTKSLRMWLLNTKYWVRPFIDRSDPQALYDTVKKYVDVMWPLVRLVRKVPGLGVRLPSRLLILDYSRLVPKADDATLKEWAQLDTFDMLSPIYDKPQTPKAFRRWFEKAGLTEINVRASHQSKSTTVGTAVRDHTEAPALRESVAPDRAGYG